jgi:hypothetical protein
MSKKWTQQDIYAPACTWMPADVDRELIDTMPLAFRSKFMTAYQSESNWKQTDAAPVKDLSGIT